MLTRAEQDEIMRKAKALARKHVETRRRLQSSEVSPRRARELVDQAEEELRDLLKEVG